MNAYDAWTAGISGSWVSLIVKATLVLASAGAITRMMRRASASARHTVWAAALASLLLLPWLTVALPPWRLAVLPAAGGPKDADRMLAEDAGHRAPPDASEDALHKIVAFPAPPVRAGATTYWCDWLFTVWATGVIAGLGHLMAGAVYIHRFVGRAEVVAEASWQRLMTSSVERLGLRRSVILKRSPRVQVPLVWGLRRPVVLLPLEADLWPEPRRAAFLLHELAHVARRDAATQILALVVRAFYWPHPLAWWAVARLQQEAERACDDRVLHAGADATT